MKVCTWNAVYVLRQTAWEVRGLAGAGVAIVVCQYLPVVSILRVLPIVGILWDAHEGCFCRHRPP